MHTPILHHSSVAYRNEQSMTDPLAAFNDLMLASLDDEHDVTSRAVQNAVSAANARGMLNSTARYQASGRAISEGIGRFRLSVDEKWKTYMKPRLSTLFDADRQAYINAAATVFDTGAAKLKGTYDGRPNRGMEKEGLDVIHAAVDRERRLLVAELNLYSALPPAHTPAGTIQVTTHGPNSPVNVGSGMLAQSVSTTVSMTDLSKALGDLLIAFDTHHAGAAPELRQVIEDAKTETEKPAPNRLRLKGSLTAVKDAVQTLGGLNQAWDSVVNVASKIIGLF